MEGWGRSLLSQRIAQVMAAGFSTGHAVKALGSAGTELGERPDAHNMILPCCDDLVEERVKWANDTEMLLCVVPSVTTT
eukprot:5660281-Amphidinium_carterae.1